jgi:hypothetical protein
MKRAILTLALLLAPISAFAKDAMATHTTDPMAMSGKHSPMMVRKSSASMLSAPKSTRLAGNDCSVVGNTQSKIYHLQGGAYASKITNKECFTTEMAAKKAGYRKAK